MKDSCTIYFEKSGGFTGRTITLVLDNKQLGEDEWEQIRLLIKRANFFEFGAVTSGEPLPDQLMYRISVETSSQRHTISIFEHQVTEELRPLIRYLSMKARGKEKR